MSYHIIEIELIVHTLFHICSYKFVFLFCFLVIIGSYSCKDKVNSRRILVKIHHKETEFEKTFYHPILKSKNPTRRGISDIHRIPIPLALFSCQNGFPWISFPIFSRTTICSPFFGFSCWTSNLKTQPSVLATHEISLYILLMYWSIQENSCSICWIYTSSVWLVIAIEHRWEKANKLSLCGQKNFKLLLLVYYMGLYSNVERFGNSCLLHHG